MTRPAAGRRRSIAGLVVVIVVALVATSSAALVGSSAEPRATSPGSGLEVVAERGVPDAVLVSRTLFDSAPAAVVVGGGADGAAIGGGAQAARTRGVPMFHVDPTSMGAVRSELARLGVDRVLTIGEVPDLGVPSTSDPGDLGAAGDDGAREPAGDAAVVLLVDPGADAVATAEAAGARTEVLPTADPRSSGSAVESLRSSPDAPVRAVGAAFADERLLRERIGLARSVPELPGGGQIMFPGRRVVALYGSPGAPELGPLGRQSIEESVARAERVAAEYDGVSPVPVVPGFEIIVSVASSDPGPDGAYSTMLDPEAVRPWVDAAAAAGVYVTLDLQPGRTDFLAQAKRYEGLLTQPHVGLALDPEWRLRADQVHLTQIGSVAPEEVNRVSAWLSGLVRAHGLPQKAFVLHQFDADMLGDRSRIDTRHPELAVVVHADGHGTPPVKLETWRRIVDGLPPGAWTGWKNFYREDSPMFSPRRTMRVRPVPWFISYQ
ncbi:hypothetical protein [Gordonia shandongensis]|uniref:hypothetical protein n=1 Tax=Gordonia shandongensis TaxID=376351 RepID=UPI00042149D2|nr:hypothetical protein [Gordonia shandongensis]